MEKLLQIILTDSEGTALESLNDKLASLKKTRESFSIDEQNAGFQWHTGNNNAMTETIYPAQLNLIILQFEAAAEKLTSGHFAILHYGEYGGERSSYVLINPVNEQASLSVFFINDSPVDSTLPIKGIIGDPKDLYKYASENMETILSSPPNDGMYFKNINVSLSNLVLCLQQEAAAGRELYALLNKELNNQIV